MLVFVARYGVAGARIGFLLRLGCRYRWAEPVGVVAARNPFRSGQRPGTGSVLGGVLAALGGLTHQGYGLVQPFVSGSQTGVGDRLSGTLAGDLVRIRVCRADGLGEFVQGGLGRAASLAGLRARSRTLLRALTCTAVVCRGLRRHRCAAGVASGLLFVEGSGGGLRRGLAVRGRGLDGGLRVRGLWLAVQNLGRGSGGSANPVHSLWIGSGRHIRNGPAGFVPALP